MMDNERHSKIPLPQAASGPAQAFIKANPPSDEPLNIHQNWALYREQTRLSFDEASQKSYDTYVERIEDHLVVGHRVSRIVPKTYDPDKSIGTLYYLFGGGHNSGSPWEGITQMGPIAYATGMDIWALHYPLAPESPFPTALNDSVEVYKELVERFGAKNMGVFGDSAGGNLSLVTVLQAIADGAEAPCAMALLSPWCDLTGTGDTMHTLNGIDPCLNYDKYLAPAAQIYAGEYSLTNPLISPVYAAFPPSFPPTMITTGTRDMLLSDSARLHRNLKRAGIATVLNVWDGMWHDFEFYPEVPEALESLNEVSAFFLSILSAAKS